MKGLSYKWVVAIVIVFGLFMSILDTTIVNIAIPRLQTAFGASLTDVDWVSTGYTLAEGVGTPVTPFFAAVLGNKRFYLILLVLFTAGSALCGLSVSLTMLIIFRIVQGLAGASLLPLSITLLYSVFPPEERGAALGVLGIPILLAPALGPTVGGYIITYANWPLIFYINLPIGIIGFFMASIFLQEDTPEGGRYFDLPGFIFASIGLSSILYAFSDAGTDGWGSTKVLSFLTIGVTSLAVLIIVELVTVELGKQPLLDLRLFKYRSFSGGNIGTVMVTFGLYGGLYLVPIYLESLRGQTAYEAGVLLLPQALGSMFASVIGGRLVDRLGVKPVVIPGLLLLCWAMWGFAHTTLQTPFAQIQLLLMLRGFGLGLSSQPLIASALAEVPVPLLSQGSSLNSVIRSVTGSLAVGLLTTLVATQRKIHTNHLLSMVTPDSSTGKTLLPALSGYFAGHSTHPQSASAAAAYVVVSRLQQTGFLLAIQDAFLISLGVALLAILVVIFIIKTPPKRKAKQVAKNSGGDAGVMQESEQHVFAH